MDGVISLPSAFKVQDEIQWQKEVEEYNGIEAAAEQVTAYVFVYIQSKNLNESDENKKQFVQMISENPYIIEANPIYKADDVIVKIQAHTVQIVNQVIMGDIQKQITPKGDGANRIQGALTTSFYGIESMRWCDKQVEHIGKAAFAPIEEYLCV